MSLAAGQFWNASTDPVEFEDCYATEETFDALQVKLPMLDHPIWIAKTNIHEDSEVTDTEAGCGPGTLVIYEWTAYEMGLI